jgi:hypothetical protein
MDITKADITKADITKDQLFALVDKIPTTPENKTMWKNRITHAKYDDYGGILTGLNYYFPNGGGRRRNKSKNIEMKMVDVKRLCKNNQIKLSKTVNGKRVVYTKKELITKLKRKKLL